MPDCPTGAIGRDPRGEVFIRDALCTGCGACAKGCPWDNIQIVPRPPGSPRPPGGVFEDLAVKCDLCRDYLGPACVQACPTESIFRLNPSEDLPDVGRVLRAPQGGVGPARGESRWPLFVFVGCATLALGLYGVTQHQRGAWAAWRGIGFAMGPLAAALFVALLAYVIPKRLVRVWQRKRGDRRLADERPAVRSRMRPQLTLHAVLGCLALGVALAHGGPAFNASTGGALLTAFFLAGLSGIVLAWSYAVVPRWLARLERSALLPEDYASMRRELRDQLYGSITGKSELVKKLFEKVLAPHLRHPLGPLWMVVAGRTLASEEALVRARIDAMLQGRGAERLAGLDNLIRVVVELRGLAAARALTRWLRLWLPVHVALVAIAAILLVTHLVEVL
jgi:ferredoxin